MLQIGDWVTQYSAGYWQVVGIRDKYAEEDNVTGEHLNLLMNLCLLLTIMLRD